MFGITKIINYRGYYNTLQTKNEQISQCKYSSQVNSLRFTEKQVSQKITLYILLTPEDRQLCKWPIALLRSRQALLDQMQKHEETQRQLRMATISLSLSKKPQDIGRSNKKQNNGVNLRINSCISSVFQQVGSLLLKPFSKSSKSPEHQKASKLLVELEEQSCLLAAKSEEIITCDSGISSKRRNQNDFTFLRIKEYYNELTHLLQGVQKTTTGTSYLYSKSDNIIYKAISNREMETLTLQHKQHYLRQNIIEAGYDPQKFVQFCTQTHDLDDLQNWSMHELVDIVQRFRTQQAKQLPPFKLQSQQAYKQSTKVSTPVEPLPEHKLAINISDQDWTDFLSAPSLLQTPKTNIVPLPTDLVFDFGFGTTNQNDKSKDIPLSPPSNLNKKISEEPTSLPRGLQRVAQITRTPVSTKSEKTQSKNIKQALPINLSNIKVSTAKQKLQPLLPLINDVIVTKTEQVSRNFLQGDYTLYHISFPPTQHVVKRKFADLRKVRALLQKYYPFLRLPYLQPEGWLSSSQGKDHQVLQRYKLMTEQFIKYVLLKSKQLKDCELVRILCGFSFNGLKDDLKKKIQALQVASRPKSIGDVLLTQNSFLIPPVNSNDNLLSNTLHLLSQIDIQYDRLRKQLQSLFNVHQTLIKSYNEIAFTFETLQNLTKKYNMDNNQPKQQRIYDGFKEMIIKISTQINRESDIFKAKIRNLFKYEKENMATLKEVFQLRNKIHSEYQRQGNPPFTSNSMRIQGSNVQVQSPIPLQQPIRQNKNTLALQQIFWSFTTSRQINRYWQHLRRKITENLTLIAYDQLDSENQNLNFWNSIIKKCVI